MTGEDPIVELIQKALEAQAAGETVDLETVCASHPELIPVVRSSLALDGEIRASVNKDPLLATSLNGRYQLQSWLGSGAMGVVYAARDLSLDRDVAVKVLQQGVFASDARRSRFEREARVLAALQHDNVVRVHDHGVSEAGYHFIVMDRIDGESLALHLRAEAEAQGTPTFDWIPKAVTWCAEIASALHAAHEARVLHRDVKPSNILIDAQGRAILVDFGIAARSGEASLTADGSTLGTPSYMSPEAAADASTVDERVDVYGLAATLYHLVTFRPPFMGSYHSVVLKLRQSDPTPPGKVQLGLPKDLCAIIEKGMHRDPKRRYASMMEFERDLQAFLVHRPVIARPVTFLERRWRELKRQKWAVSAVVAAGLAIGITAKVSADREEARLQAEVDIKQESDLLHAELPPNLGFEGSIESRRRLDTEERQEQIQHVRRLVEIRPSSRFHRMLLVELLLDQGKHVLAADEFAGLVGDSGVSTPYLDGLQIRFRDAEALDRSTLAVSSEGLPKPESDLGRFVAAFRNIRRKRHDLAILDLQGAADEPGVRELMLNLHLWQWDQTKKHIHLDRLNDLLLRIQTDTGYPTARHLYFRGTSHLKRKDNESARDALVEAAELCESFSITFNLGIAYLRLQPSSRAEPLFSRAILLRPENGNAYGNLALVLARLGRFPEARQTIEEIPAQARLITPWYADYYMGLIGLTEAFGFAVADDLDGSKTAASESIKAFDRALGLAKAGNRRSIENDRLIARLYRDQDPSLLPALARRVVKHPNNIEFIRALGAAMLMQSQPGTFRRVLAEAIRAIDHARR